jgi:hypothetical protein
MRPQLDQRVATWGGDQDTPAGSRQRVGSRKVDHDGMKNRMGMGMGLGRVGYE